MISILSVKCFQLISIIVLIRYEVSFAFAKADFLKAFPAI
ncbi:hypothetical protein NMS_1818 [Nonlabens marinus S1-08]|uniref:Uncharacterized protein n=1 Tax=Nonlabens marinus S1-08 TaxID=1454201 RepID=W8VXF3_9FLAO|nr:hypothetical protein NMS_1818 [Nonlabens marinus S1-08]